MIQTSKSCHFTSSSPAVWLVDNGSLRAESILALREQAARLSQAAGIRVEAVSVLHSAKVPAEQLGGIPALTFTPYLRLRAQSGLDKLLVVPYFFGPSAALTDYLPQQIARIQQEFPLLEVKIAPPLVDLGDPSDDAAGMLAAILADNVTTLLQAQSGNLMPPGVQGFAGSDAGGGGVLHSVGGSALRPAVVLVDHGSPQQAVSAVRDHVGEKLRERLAGEVSAFAICSMEARDGAEYAHTLPLMEQVLAQKPFCSSRVIIAPLFLSPGRHAGEGGDLWQIAERVRAAYPSLSVTFSALVGANPGITAILLRRLRVGMDSFC